MRRAIQWGVVCLMTTAATGCAARPSAGHIDTLNAQARFSGSWSVQWCDQGRPALDCGGFAVTLVQQGHRVCGDFSGALVNLRQVDEGAIAGIVEGEVAMLEVTSGRGETIMRIRATRVGRDLHWTQVGVTQQGNSDIDVIALDDALRPDATTHRRVPERCTPYVD